jgi:TolB-like protein
MQPTPPRLSMVVLPFANTTRDLEHEYLAEGPTEDLTTDLSRIPGAFVIAPSTAFSYRGCEPLVAFNSRTSLSMSALNEHCASGAFE